MQSQLFEAVPNGNTPLFVDATARAGPDLGMMRSARGVAFADADDDGDVDALIVDMDEMPRLLENRTARRGHWISVRTVGTESNRDGIGAVVRVRAGGKIRAREMRTTQGLYSSHDPRLHFGLGSADRVEFVEVSWPSGRKSRVENPPIDQPLVMKEPTGASP
jgi:hypothetical protein